MDSEGLEKLVVGDSFFLSGVQWAVRDLNYFMDPSGYRTTEWRIESRWEGEYYLMVEHDPAQSAPVWYLSERLPSPKILQPDTGKDIYGRLKESFATNVSPPPALMVQGTTFLFESSSSGEFGGEHEQRTTWEYWDQTHSRNLALEFWYQGDLLVYVARTIAPEKVYDVERGGAKRPVGAFFSQDAPSMLEWGCAIAVTLLGLFIFLKGIGK